MLSITLMTGLAMATAPEWTGPGDSLICTTAAAQVRSPTWNVVDGILTVRAQPGIALTVQHTLVTRGYEQTWETPTGVVPDSGVVLVELQIPESIHLEESTESDLKTTVIGQVHTIAPLVFVTWSGGELELNARRTEVAQGAEIIRRYGVLHATLLEAEPDPARLSIEDTGGAH